MRCLPPALSVALLASSVPALAQQAERPTPFVGYQMSYSGRIMGVACGDWRITEILSGGDVISTCGEYRLEFSGANDLNAVRLLDGAGQKLVEFTPYAPNLKFPMAIGNHWQAPYVAYTADNGLIWEGSAECRVEAYEPVTVAAGTFNAFRIECRDKWQVGPRSGYTHATRWYAPEAAVVVKSVQREDPARWNFELTRFGMAEALPQTVPAAPPPPAALSGSRMDEVLPIRDPDDY